MPIHSCEGFIELGHGHQKKIQSCWGNFWGLWGERERERGRNTPSLVFFFYKKEDGQKSAPSRLSLQPASKAKALWTVIRFPAGSRVKSVWSSSFTVSCAITGQREGGTTDVFFLAVKSLEKNFEGQRQCQPNNSNKRTKTEGQELQSKVKLHVSL